MEKALVQAQTTELLDANLVELSKSDYALTIVMPKRIFLAIGWNSTCAGITTQSTNTHI